MSTYSIFSLAALILKIVLTVKLIVNKNKVGTAFIWLLALLFALSLLEFMALSGLLHSIVGFKFFYVFLILALAMILVVIKSLSKLDTKLPEVMLILGIIQSSMLFSTDLIVAGFKEGGIGYTRIPGDHYYIFQFYVLVCLILTIYFAVKVVYDRKKRSNLRAKAAVLLVSLFPLVLGLLIVLLLMALGKNVNAAVLLPITTTIFLFGCFYAIDSKKTLDCSIFMPFSPSWQAKKDLVFFLYSSNDKSEVWKRLKALERIYIEEAMKENLGKGQLTNAARSLGITPGKLDYRLKSIHQLNDK